MFSKFDGPPTGLEPTAGPGATSAPRAQLERHAGSDPLKGASFASQETKDGGNPPSMEVYDRRDLVPWTQRPLLQRLMDLPGEMWREHQRTPMPLHEVERRVGHIWSLTHEQMELVVNPRVVQLLTDIYHRRSEKADGYIGDLVYQYNHGCIEAKSAIALSPKMTILGDRVRLVITPDATYRFAPEDNARVSESATKEFLLSVLSFAKSLKELNPSLSFLEVEYAPGGGRLHSSLCAHWYNHRVAHQFGLKDQFPRLSCKL